MMYSSRNMEENYNALLDLPIVKKLIQKNTKLRKENKALKSLIYSLPEFRCVCRTTSIDSPVHIKREKEDTIPVQCETLVEDDEVVYVAHESDVKKINIVYEIEEDAEEDADAVEEEEDDADAVEEEEEDADAVEEEDADAVEEEEEEEDADAVEEEDEDADAVEEEEEDADAVEEEDADALEEEAEAEEETVFVVTVSGKSYYTTDKDNGKIYAIDANEDVGDEIGEFKKGKATFYKK